MGIMYGLIFYKTELDQEGIMNINSLIFLSVIYSSVIYLFGEIKVNFVLKILIFKKKFFL